MTVQLRGVLTALATPFTADGRVDEALLRKVVDRSIDGRRARGRGLRLHRRIHRVERRRAPPAWSRPSSTRPARRVPVIAQTGATSTAEAIRLSRHAAVGRAPT